MGRYLNTGCESFQNALKSDIYVDKSLLIAELNKVINKDKRFVCVSRPRRFGKSMTADMVSAYYDRTVDGNIFHNLRINTIEGMSEQGKYDVIHINMLDFMRRDGDVSKELELLQRVICRELLSEYPDVTATNENDLMFTLGDVYEVTRRRFVFVIDEWDCLFRQKSTLSKEARENEQMQYLDFLRFILKDRTYVALAYMTGIFPIKKYGEHSALNIFTEISMLSPSWYAPFTGFTDDEVTELCKTHGISNDTIREWYDGYVVDTGYPSAVAQEYLDQALQKYKVYHIYCPMSVSYAVSSGEIRNYWNSTENYIALKDNINRNFDGLHEIIAMLMKGGRQKINTEKYQNDMENFSSADDVLTMLVHLGYLGYDARSQEVFIPNRELISVFESSIEDDERWDVLFEITA